MAVLTTRMLAASWAARPKVTTQRSPWRNSRGVAVDASRRLGKPDSRRLSGGENQIGVGVIAATFGSIGPSTFFVIVLSTNDHRTDVTM